MKLRVRMYTHSERQTWRDCHSRWGFAYAERLRPERSPPPLREGTLYHKVLARSTLEAYEHWGRCPMMDGYDVAYWAAQHAEAEMCRELDQAVAQANLDDVQDVEDSRPWLEFASKHYFESTASDWEEYKLLGCELPFEVPLRDSKGRVIPHATYGGMIDLLMLHVPTWRVVVMDHKGLTTLTGLERKLQLDEQTTGYLYAARELFRAGRLATLLPPELTEAAFSGVSFNVARKAAPAKPRVNRIKKDDCGPTLDYKATKALEDVDGVSRGRVSVAACDTLPELYAEALRVQVEERRIEIDDEQRGFLRSLHNRGDTFFARFENVRTPKDLDRWVAEFVQEQAQMRAAELDARLRTRNPGSCTRPGQASCPYQPLDEANEPPSTRYGKPVFGYVRLDDPHEEIARGKQEKEQWERDRDQRQQAQDGASSGGDGRHPGQDQAGAGHGDAPARQGVEGEQGRRESADPHHPFF